MSSPDHIFEQALKTFETHVAEATQFWFAAASMNEVANQNSDTLYALNVTPAFWLTARAAMEYQAIIGVGKIFGPRKTNPHNIDSLFELLRKHRVAVFSKEALAARKRGMSQNADEWLADYMKRVHVPTVHDVNRLHERSSRHRKTYVTQYADVRNLHVAHTAIIDVNARSQMFQKTRIRDFEKLIVFLNRLYEALWRMYYDGQRPTLRPMAYSTRSLVAKPLDDLSRNRTHEYIVAETRRCLALFTDAVRSKAGESMR